MFSSISLVSYLYVLLILNIIIAIFIISEIHKKKKEALPKGKIVKIWDGIERRRFKRIKTDLSIKYEVSDNPKSYQEVPTRDISKGGIGLVIYEKLKEGTPLRIWLELPDRKEKFLILGEIVWQREVSKDSFNKRVFYAGVRFTAVDTLTQLRLFDFLSFLERKEMENEKTNNRKETG